MNENGVGAVGDFYNCHGKALRVMKDVYIVTRPLGKLCLLCLILFCSLFYFSSIVLLREAHFIRD